MKQQVIRFATGQVILCCLGAAIFAQDKQAPFTKQELLQRLKAVPGQRSEQGDLAGEIDQRGVAFPVNEKTLQELRQAGARNFIIEAIRRVDPNTKQPAAEPQTIEPAPAPDRPRLRLPDETPQPKAPEMSEEERNAARAAALAQMPLLEQARVHAGEYLEELPNFIVTQYVTRSVRLPDSKDWKVEDKLEVDLSYHEKHGEQLKLLKLNGKPTTMSYQSLGGATSTGEFGSMLGALFSEQSRADFKEVKSETLRGHLTTVFSFRVKKAFSSFQITDKNSGRTITTAYEGTVWIENATGRALRIEQSAIDIQRGFPITLSENAVDYDWISIADLKFLLPITAEVMLGQDAERFYSRNLIELRNYRMFDSDVKIVP